METSSLQPQETQSSVPPVLEVPEIEIEVIGPSPDELPDASFISNPSYSFPSNISEDMLGRICLRHGLSMDDVLLPGPNDRPHNPPRNIPHSIATRAQLGDSLHLTSI